MHLGNVYAALMSWLSAKQQGGKWVLRIEDLDPQRSRLEYARLLEDDLQWLGLEWDEGGMDAQGALDSYLQSERSDFYKVALTKLENKGLTFPCRCTRADVMATQAPHQSDGRVVYAGTCRPPRLGGTASDNSEAAVRATRIWVPDETISFDDRVYGLQSVNLAHHCGDFVLQRSDGAWAYQLAVVVDDALMGITEVVRGNDLLLSAAQQIYLYGLLGYPAPEFAHIPLLCNASGQRLSKRDQGVDMGYLRQHFTAEEIIGRLAYFCGLIPCFEPVSAIELKARFDWTRVPRIPSIQI